MASGEFDRAYAASTATHKLTVAITAELDALEGAKLNG